MTGFRLDDGSGGCPPTASAPGDYEIPFRFDGAGSLWITSCFKGSDTSVLLDTVFLSQY